MKRKILSFLLVLILAVSVVSASVAWTPSASAGLGLNSVDFYNGNYGGIKGFRPAFEVAAELDLLAMRVDNHYISLPITYEYIGETAVIGSTIVNPRQNFIMSLEYGYSFCDWFRLYVSGDMLFRWYNKEHAGAWNFGGTITPAFVMTENFMFQIPLSVHGGKDEVTLDARIMFTLMFDIGKE